MPTQERPSQLPVTVTAPIIIDATTAEGVQPFLDFVHQLEGHSNTEIAAEEDRRLQPYFSSMSAYLTRAIDKADPEKVNKAELGKLTTRGALSGIFNAMAAKTHNTMTSDVVIMPDNIYTTGPASHLFEGRRAFNTNYNYCGHSFNFGFFQVFEMGDNPVFLIDNDQVTEVSNKKIKRSSTTFPTFRIDHRMMDKVPPSQLTSLLRDFQKVMTFVNHDMLHHFTSPIINSGTVKKFGDNDKQMSAWDDKIPYVSIGGSYEHWAQIGHEKALIAPENTVLLDDIRTKLDHYFDELKRVGESLMQKNKPNTPITSTLANIFNRKEHEAHEVIDYFGMVMAHALTRVFPLNHPIMTHCLQSLQKADPEPQRALMDCHKMMKPEWDYLEAPQVFDPFSSAIYIARYAKRFAARHAKKSPSKLLTAIRDAATKYDGGISDIVLSYRDQGHEILPEDNAAASYIKLKSLQLAELSRDEVHAHIPVPSDSSMAKLRSATDQLTLDMIIAAAKTSNYTPAQRARPQN
ncbi:MAG: hypothetical protein HY052_09425 [Proteobacteria bacterium]|nr:hypothetical protein [Pseudomonadota bacterium]